MGTLKFDVIIDGTSALAKIGALYLKEKGLKVALLGDNRKIKWPASAHVALNLSHLQMLSDVGINLSHTRFFDTIDVRMNHVPLIFSSSDIFYQNFGAIVELEGLNKASTKAAAKIPQITGKDWDQQGDYLLCLKPHRFENSPAAQLKHHVATALIMATGWESTTARQYFDNNEIFGILPTEKKNTFALIHCSAKKYDTSSLLKRLQKISAEVDSIDAFQDYQPIHSFHYDNYHHGRLIGCHNACHMVHPMAGFGLNMGLSDIRSLGYHSLNNLPDYASDRFTKNSQTIAILQSLYQLYCDPGFRASIVDFSVSQINQTRLLKSFFMTQAQSV